jgi:hypothetical protein
MLARQHCGKAVRGQTVEVSRCRQDRFNTLFAAIRNGYAFFHSQPLHRLSISTILHAALSRVESTVSSG